MRPLVLTALVLAASGCAATPRQIASQQATEQARGQKLADRLAGYTPGRPVDCLSNQGNRATEAIGATILYKEGNGLIYRNDTSGGCEGMEHGDYIVTVSNEGRLCRGDIGRTFTPTIRVPTGSCALGAFTPYTRDRAVTGRTG